MNDHDPTCPLRAELAKPALHQQMGVYCTCADYTKARLDKLLDTLSDLRMTHARAVSTVRALGGQVSELADEVKRVCQHDEQILREQRHTSDGEGNGWTTNYYTCSVCRAALAEAEVVWGPMIARLLRTTDEHWTLIDQWHNEARLFQADDPTKHVRRLGGRY